MRASGKVGYCFSLFLLIVFLNLTVSEDYASEKERIKVCEHCTCSEIPNEDSTHLVLNIQCSELDNIENLPDLDKIEWPENTNSLKISATFEGLGVSTLGKLPPNPLVESLRFSNNAIKTYWPDPFSDVSNLKKLSFAQNELTEITPDLFTNIHKLEDLDISFNRLTYFNALDFQDLKVLKRLNLQSNSLKTVPIDALEPLTSLEDLDLSKNGIYDLLLKKTGSETLKRVKRLSMSGNRIRSIVKDSFPEDNSLELLDLSNNIIEIIEEEAFLKSNNLRELNLAQNNITTVVPFPPSLQIAILKHNLLTSWPKFPNGITYIDMSYNKLKEWYDQNSVNFENLEVLTVTGNQLTDFNVEVKLPKLFNLDISYNLIDTIPSELNQETFPNLEELRLDGNPISVINFKSIISLRSLYMNDLKKLYSVGAKAFSNVVGRSMNDKNGERCFSLYLSNCPNLNKIEDGAFDATSICMLDISHNNLTHLSRSLLDWSSLTEGVNLQWNPWDCQCHLQWFLDELLPSMYTNHSRLLTQLRCESPRAAQGLRIVHWYNWTERVLCSDSLYRSEPHTTFLLEPSTEPSRSKVTSTTYILGSCIIVALLIAIALSVYLVKNRKRHRIRQAALKRKRQSALDARNSTGQDQIAALNKV